MSVPSQTFDVLGVSLNAVTMREALETFRDQVLNRRPGYFVFCTVSSILSARDDPAVAQAIAGANLVAPDGMPLVWLGRKRASRPTERVYGPDFLRAVIDEREPIRHFFYGGSEGVADRVADFVRLRDPSCLVVGTYSPPLLAPGEPDEEVISIIDECRPDVVWVGLGHPKQELWMELMSPRLDVPVLAGVGAAFDYLSGRRKEAPSWMKKSGLQWLHRLASEPRRLWRRYILGNSKFLWLLLREHVRKRSG